MSSTDDRRRRREERQQQQQQYKQSQQYQQQPQQQQYQQPQAPLPIAQPVIISSAPSQQPPIQTSGAQQTKKYRFVNGQLITNDETSKRQIAVVSSPTQLAQVVEVASQNNVAIVVPPPTQQAIEGFYDDKFIEEYKAPQGTVSGDGLLDAIGAQFAKYEVPLGLLPILLKLKTYRLNFIMDDSGSMQLDTDSTKGEAGSFMMQRYTARNASLSARMSRWEEAEDRLHIMIDFIAYIPCQLVIISFLNRSTKIQLDRNGKTPEMFANEAHNLIQNAFASQPSSGTPIYGRLREAFGASYVPTMHYLFTDGQPSDATPDQVCNLVLSRNNPQNNPIVFVSCSNEDEATGWMKGVDERGPFISEVDDYNDEKDEIYKDQGSAFPFTKGLWLMSLLVGPLSPDVLDALDESNPLTKHTFDFIMGRTLTPEEYQHYWNKHPRSRNYQQYFTRFVGEPRSAKEILSPNTYNYQGVPVAHAIIST